MYYVIKYEGETVNTTNHWMDAAMKVIEIKETKCKSPDDLLLIQIWEYSWMNSIYNFFISLLKSFLCSFFFDFYILCITNHKLKERSTCYVWSEEEQKIVIL